MASQRKVAFVSTLSSACVHRRMRGALSYADAHPQILIRNFPLPIGFTSCNDPIAVVEQLRDWHPDGVLALLADADLQQLIKRLPPACPVANMASAPPRPGVAQVLGSFPAIMQVAVRHFRQQGLRSIALFMAENAGLLLARFTTPFNRIVQPAQPEQAMLMETIPPDLLANPESSVRPVPRRLAAWLHSLPKPVGIFCPTYGGGGYLVRVCHALALRVPEDIAVICADDVDLCLASSPTLTSVEAASEVIGFEATKVLDQMMKGRPAPASTVHVAVADLHVRQSTGMRTAEICDVAAAVTYINQHACRGLTVAQLLQETQRVSRMTFHKHFQAATGQTPGEAIRARQFAQARRLLAETKLPITLVAEQSGFGSSSDFARAFRAAQGMSPRAYRDGAGTQVPEAKRKAPARSRER